MTYIAGEKLAETQIQNVTGFSSTNVDRGSKWKILNSGNSDHYAVLHKGQHQEPFLSMGIKEKQWRTVIEVLQRVKDDLTDRYDALLGYADSITARIDQYFQLADTTDTIRDATISGGDEVKEIWINDSLAWISVELYLDWTEEAVVTYAE